MVTPKMRDTQLMKCHIMRSLEIEKCWIFVLLSVNFALIYCDVNLATRHWIHGNILMFAHFQQQLTCFKHNHGKCWEVAKTYFICIFRFGKLAMANSGEQRARVCACGWDLWANEFVSKICTQAVALDAHCTFWALLYLQLSIWII